MPRTPNSTSDADNALPTKMKLLAYRDVEWTEEIDNAIGTESDSIIGHRFGISPRSITVRRRRLGKLVFRASPTDLKWSKSMDRQLGTMPDTELAKRLNIDVYWIRHRRQELGVAALGVSEGLVAGKRAEHNIPPFKSSAPYEWSAESLRRLGKLPDEELALELGLSYQFIAQKRLELGRPAMRRSSLKWTSEIISKLGTIPDPQIAKELGCSTGLVQLKRSELGISAYSS